MQWEGKEEAGDVEDRRSMKPAAVAGGGIGALVLAAVVYLVTGDANLAKQAQNQLGGAGGAAQQAGPPVNDKTKKFTETVLGMTNKVWDEQFPKTGKKYSHPQLVLFHTAVKTGGCGNAPSEVGPFYCPADRKLYIDPDFFQVLEKKLGGSADEFSQSYVIAHEVGHHVQNLLGYNSRLGEFEQSEGKNAGIRLELQADYLAGVWAHYAEEKYRILEPGDVERAIKTANSIGDDTITGGRSSPQGFTHGTSQQRMKYLRQGLQSGKFDKATLDHFFDPSINPLKL